MSVSSMLIGGPNLCTKYPSRGGGCIEEGGYKIPAAGGFKTCTSLPLKMPCGQKRGKGRGGIPDAMIARQK